MLTVHLHGCASRSELDALATLSIVLRTAIETLFIEADDFVGHCIFTQF